MRITSSLHAHSPLPLARLLSRACAALLAGASVHAQEGSPIRDAFAPDAVTVEQMVERAATHPFVPGQVVVLLRLAGGPTQAAGLLDAIDWERRTGATGAALDRRLLTHTRTPGSALALALVDLKGGDPLEALRALAGTPGVLWSAPNFVSPLADPRELVPDDPMYGSQYHHPLMQNDLAWDLTLGSASVVVAITDDGVDLDHEDLAAGVWVNAGEIAGNGIDDDGNGYVDDVKGWDFINNNNNPDHNGSDDHGSHTTGIVGARTNNGVGVAGTAGGCTVMAVQFYSSAAGWNAAEIAAAYAYTADNGARITTTSYNVDGWVGDPVFTAGLQYMYDQGVMHFNSAGNGSAANPPRQAFEQSLFVVSTDSNDVKSGFSNWGTGVDISAPGGSILSTTPNDTYSFYSGTSMASPNAAAVAALIWSLNPGWTREQVACQLMATADDIDGNNPGLEGLLGAGRANSFRALTEAIGAPTVDAVLGLANGLESGTLQVEFDQILEPSTVDDAANYELRESGADALFGTGDDLIFAVVPSKPYRVGTNQVDLAVAGVPLPLGEYRLSLLSGGLTNPFGTALDGDGDGMAGDDFVHEFQIGPAKVAPFGSLVHTWDSAASIDALGEVDEYALKLDSGQTLSVLVRPSGGLVPDVDVRAPGGKLVGSGVPLGSGVIVQALPLRKSGSFQVAVSGAGGTTGDYSVSILLNALFEEEEAGGLSNDASSSAEDLEPGSIQLGGPAQRMAVLGRAGLGESFESGSVGADWAFTSSLPEGRVRITDEQGGAEGTAFALLMDRDPSGDYVLNEAIWTVDLSGAGAPMLSFHHAEWSDEEDVLPLSYVGSANGDGVSISDDGVNWYRILDPASQTSGVWQPFTFDLATEAANAGMSLNSSFRIKFQQYDNFPLTTDGRGWDQIKISGDDKDDWYRIALGDGQSATFGFTTDDPSATSNLDVFASDGATLLAAGVAADNLSSGVATLRDTTSDGSPDTYLLRIATAGRYALVATRGAAFDVEPNDTFVQAQSLALVGGALGYVEPNGHDTFSLVLDQGETLTVTSSLPAEGPFQFSNGLATEGGSALRLKLFDATQTLVVAGDGSLVYTAPARQTYFLRVNGAGNATGEYVLSRSVVRPKSFE